MKHGQPVGNFIKKYIHLFNEKKFENSSKNESKSIKKSNFRHILKQNGILWRRTSKRRQEKVLQRRSKQPRTVPRTPLLQPPPPLRVLAPWRPPRRPPSIAAPGRHFRHSRHGWQKSRHFAIFYYFYNDIANFHVFISFFQVWAWLRCIWESIYEFCTVKNQNLRGLRPCDP